jgi:hypothetical protein
MDLRGALVSAGLVSAAKAEQVEQEVQQKRAQAEQAEERRKRLNLYPRNRLGQPMKLAEWMVWGVIPKDLGSRCSICGQTGIHMEQSADIIVGALFERHGKDETLDDMFQRSLDKAKEIGDKGTLLSSYNVAFAPDPIRKHFEGLQLFVCRACCRYAFRTDRM